MLVTHTIAGLDGYLYITHTRSVKKQIKKLLLELSTVSALNISKRCQVGGAEKLTHTLLPTKQQ